MTHTSSKLRHKHGFVNYGNTCRNCKHFKVDERYHEPEHGIYSYNCTVDAAYDNPDQEVYILKTPWGVCNEHERVPVRG